MLSIRISPKCSADTVNMLYAAAVKASLSSDKYEGLEACRKNVIRTNNSRKLQYCREVY